MRSSIIQPFPSFPLINIPVASPSPDRRNDRPDVPNRRSNLGRPKSPRENPGETRTHTHTILFIFREQPNHPPKTTSNQVKHLDFGRETHSRDFSSQPGFVHPRFGLPPGHHQAFFPALRSNRRRCWRVHDLGGPGSGGSGCSAAHAGGVGLVGLVTNEERTQVLMRKTCTKRKWLGGASVLGGHAHPSWSVFLDCLAVARYTFSSGSRTRRTSHTNDSARSRETLFYGRTPRALRKLLQLSDVAQGVNVLRAPRLIPCACLQDPALPPLLKSLEGGSEGGEMGIPLVFWALWRGETGAVTHPKFLFFAFSRSCWTLWAPFFANSDGADGAVFGLPPLAAEWCSRSKTKCK